PCLCSFPQGLTHIYPHFHSLTLSLSLKVSLCLSLTFLSIGPCPWNKSSLFFSDTFTLSLSTTPPSNLPLSNIMATYSLVCVCVCVSLCVCSCPLKHHDHI